MLSDVRADVIIDAATDIGANKTADVMTDLKLVVLPALLEDSKLFS